MLCDLQKANLGCFPPADSQRHLARFAGPFQSEFDGKFCDRSAPVRGRSNTQTGQSFSLFALRRVGRVAAAETSAFRTPGRVAAGTGQARCLSHYFANF